MRFKTKYPATNSDATNKKYVDSHQLLEYTTTERNAITWEIGQIIYNSTTNKFQGYNGSSWLDFN